MGRTLICFSSCLKAAICKLGHGMQGGTMSLVLTHAKQINLCSFAVRLSKARGMLLGEVHGVHTPPGLCLPQVITGDKAVPIAGQQGMYRLEHAGTEFHADVVYWCTGTKACSTWLQKLHPDVLDSQGLIKVWTASRSAPPKVD